VPVGGSFEGQVALAFDNVRLALAAAGCIPADAVQVRIYVVDLDPAKIDPIKAALADLFGDDGPPDSLIGVAALAMPELHIEIEVLAVRPEHRA
jgi:enamine deaminase RidA (YjgF/YER057c/UK114 family)